MDVFCINLFPSDHELIQQVRDEQVLRELSDSRILHGDIATVDYNIKKAKSFFLEGDIFEELKSELIKKIQLKIYFLTSEKVEVVTYRQGDYVTRHKDYNSVFVSKGTPSVLIIYIDPATKGGETIINGKVVNPDVKSGDVIIFPKDSYHESSPVIEGTKIVVIFDIILFPPYHKLYELKFHDRSIYVDEGIIEQKLKRTVVYIQLDFEKAKNENISTIYIKTLNSIVFLHITGLIDFKEDLQYIYFLTTPIEEQLFKKINKFLDSPDAILEVNEEEYLTISETMTNTNDITCISGLFMVSSIINDEDQGEQWERVHTICIVQDKSIILELFELELDEDEHSCFHKNKLCDECEEEITKGCEKCKERIELYHEGYCVFNPFLLCDQCIPKLCEDCNEELKLEVSNGVYTGILRVDDILMDHHLEYLQTVYNGEDICDCYRYQNSFNKLLPSKKTGQILKGKHLKAPDNQLITSYILNTFIKDKGLCIGIKDEPDTPKTLINPDFLYDIAIKKSPASASRQVTLDWGRDSSHTSSSIIYQSNVVIKNSRCINKDGEMVLDI
jgi:hypothetical protein